MKINLMRHADGPMQGMLCPTDEPSLDKINKLKIGVTYKTEIHEPQDVTFHRKLFKLIGFAFDHMKYDETPHQRKKFRKDLTILAGYYHKVYNYKGELRLVAKSLKFSEMSADERRGFYDKVLDVVWTKIFKTEDENILIELMRF